VSRVNPGSDLVIKELPDLMIIDDGLWAAVKQRQEGQQKVRAAAASTDTDLPPGSSLKLM